MAGMSLRPTSPWPRRKGSKGSARPSMKCWIRLRSRSALSVGSGPESARTTERIHKIQATLLRQKPSQNPVALYQPHKPKFRHVHPRTIYLQFSNSYRSVIRAIHRKENAVMAMQAQRQTPPQSEQDRVAEKIKKVQELYADAPEIGRVALKNGLENLKRELAAATHRETAGRVGARQGKVSELTAIIPLAPGGGKRIRGLLNVLEGNFKGADLVGTLHDMRFVLMDNDTKLFFATAYDGEWDAYIDDFATKIPDSMDILFCNCEGWPGIHSPVIKDYLVKFQLTADAWYVANPNLTVAETRRLEKVGKALDEFLDKIG